MQPTILWLYWTTYDIVDLFKYLILIFNMAADDRFGNTLLRHILVHEVNNNIMNIPYWMGHISICYDIVDLEILNTELRIVINTISHIS